MSENNVIEFPAQDDLVRKYGVSSDQLRAAIKPLFLFMYDHEIPDVTIKRDGAKCVITINGQNI